jgi:small subunit ribosomal protein S20
MAIDRLKKKMGVGRHASAIKRARQNKKRRARNKMAMSKMKTAVKAARSARSAEGLAEAIPVIAKTAKKGVIHKRKAARLISRLAKFSQAK